AFSDSAFADFVEGNYIGTNLTGIGALPNTDVGVLIKTGANFNLVGGNVPAARNVISGNGAGVRISDSSTEHNFIQGNYIGLAADGFTALDNRGPGVFVTNAAASNLIGGWDSGAGNRIAHNVGAGVLIGSDPQRNFTTPAGIGNVVFANSIFANDGL